MGEVLGFDARCLTDEQLFTKQMDLIGRKLMAHRAGQVSAFTQLDIMIRAIEAERRERMFLDRAKLVPPSPVVIETDPDLRQEQLDKAVVDQPVKKSPSNRPTRRIIRSATPVLPE